LLPFERPQSKPSKKPANREIFSSRYINIIFSSKPRSPSGKLFDQKCGMNYTIRFYPKVNYKILYIIRRLIGLWNTIKLDVLSDLYNHL
jgi:hypothetical protein